MLNQKKIRTMSKTAMFERHYGEELRKAKEYYRSDYIWIEMFQNILRITLAYLAGLLLWAGYHLDRIIEKFNTMQIRGMLTGIVVLYILFLLLASVITYMMAMRHYFHGQKLLQRYQVLLERLEDEEDIEILEVTDIRRKK